MERWEEFAWEPGDEEYSGPLCIGSDRSPALLCRVEGADFRTADVEPCDDLVVCAYNVERGLKLDEQIEAFRDAAEFVSPDVLLLSEADRGCSRTGGRNVAREYAQALGMCYLYAVEFVELPRLWGPGGGAIRSRCEHGNAILSRFPLGNVRTIRHARSRSWNSRLQRWSRVGQPRLGGRIALAADLRVGERLLRLYAVHFESGRGGRGEGNRDAIRRSQAVELVDDAKGVPYPILIGGDMNVVGYQQTLRSGIADPATAALFDAGFADAHLAMDPGTRITSDSGVIIDLVVGRDVTFVASGIGSVEVWGDLSDHLPIWTRVAL